MPSIHTPPPRRWWRICAIGFAILFGVVLVGAIGLTVGLNAYLQSERFRQLISASVSAFLQADGEFMPVHWTGFSAYSDGYLARGQSDSQLHELRADQVRAEFYPRGLFRRTWQINDLEIQQLNVSFGATKPRPAEPMPAQVESPPGWLLPFLPDRLDLQRVRIQDAGVSWSAGSGTGSVRQVRAVVTPDDAAWVLEGTGGKLRQTGCPLLTLERVRLRYRAPELFITDSQLHIGETEVINVTGVVGLGDETPVNLQVKYRGVSITPFLPEDWRARLKGSAGGEARVTGALNQPDSLTVTGSLDLAGGQLEALPVLDRIALFTRTEQFRHLTLQTARAEFVWTPATLTIRKLVLESSGLLRIEGGCRVERNQLVGEFQVGVAPNVLRWLPGSQTRVFTEERGGYAWTTVRVTGPVDQLREDLSTRLITATGTEVIEGVKGTVEKGARDLLDILIPLVP